MLNKREELAMLRASNVLYNLANGVEFGEREYQIARELARELDDCMRQSRAFAKDLADIDHPQEAATAEK